MSTVRFTAHWVTVRRGFPAPEQPGERTGRSVPARTSANSRLGLDDVVQARRTTLPSEVQARSRTPSAAYKLGGVECGRACKLGAEDREQGASRSTSGWSVCDIQRMYCGRRIAVVVPAYCEERLIGRTLGRVPEYVDHVLVIDDASPDGTYEAAARVARLDPRVEVLRLGHNRGVGGAIIAGYERANRLGAFAAVVMAGDDQMDPGDMPRLLDPLVDGSADYAKGNRLVHPDAQRMPPVRRFGTRLLAHLTALTAGLDGLDDAQCGYTALRLELLDVLPVEKIFPRYGYPNDLILRLAECGARIVEVPVRPVYADEVSGLAVHRVVFPISGILLRGAARRAGLRLNE